MLFVLELVVSSVSQSLALAAPLGSQGSKARAEGAAGLVARRDSNTWLPR